MATIEEQLPLDQRRELEYLFHGVTDHALIIALWEAVIEKCTYPAELLQVICELVKKDVDK